MNQEKSLKQTTAQLIEEWKNTELERRRADIFPRIRANAISHVLPSFVAIYQRREDKPGSEQVGTGILVIQNGQPVIVTAAHVLSGHNFDEDSEEKKVFLEGELVKVGSLGHSGIRRSQGNDLAAFHAPGFPVSRCLPASAFAPPGPEMISVTIAGYLARDFRIDKPRGLLRPKPMIYTNALYDKGPGYVGILRPIHRNRDTQSGSIVMAPIPAGLSGGPMLDSIELWRGNVRIVGVFVEMHVDKGRGFGECSSKVISLLGSM